MKRVFIAVGIIILALSLSVCEYFTIKRNQETCTEKLQECEKYISDKEFLKASSLISETKNDWHHSENYLNFFINHNEVDSIESNLKTLEFYLKTGDTKSYFELSEETKKQLLSIKERQLPYLKNII